MRRTEIEADLKREMLARGMSADDIVRVLEAGASNTFSRRAQSIRRAVAAFQDRSDDR